MGWEQSGGGTFYAVCLPKYRCLMPFEMLRGIHTDLKEDKGKVVSYWISICRKEVYQTSNGIKLFCLYD